MPESTTTFTYHDPSRCFDGTPYEAAEQAVEQSRRVLRLMERALEDTRVQVRNAYMTRRLDTDEEDPGAIQWEASPEERLLLSLVERVELIETNLEWMRGKLRFLQGSAAYDPKNPPTEED